MSVTTCFSPDGLRDQLAELCQGLDDAPPSDAVEELLRLAEIRQLRAEIEAMQRSDGPHRF